MKAGMKALQEQSERENMDKFKFHVCFELYYSSREVTKSRILTLQTCGKG